MSTNSKYTKTLKRELNYFGTWLPGTPISLGDVGHFKNGIFVKETDLTELGIPYAIKKDTSKTDYKYTTNGVHIINLNSNVEVPTNTTLLKDIAAKITIHFNGKNEFLFEANGALHHSIKNFYNIGVKIKQLYDQHIWDKHWVVITDIVAADSSTILISKSKNATIELTPKISIGAKQTELAYAHLTWESSHAKNLAVEIVAQEALTPLFRARKIEMRSVPNIEKQPLIQQKSVESLSSSENSKMKNAVSLVKITLNDLQI